MYKVDKKATLSADIFKSARDPRILPIQHSKTGWEQPKSMNSNV